VAHLLTASASGFWLIQITLPGASVKEDQQ